MGNINTTEAFISDQNTVSTTVMSLVDFGFTQEQVDRATVALIFVNTNSIRADWSGGTPTVSLGALIAGFYKLERDIHIQNLRMIRNSTTDSEVFIILEF